MAKHSTDKGGEEYKGTPAAKGKDADARAFGTTKDSGRSGGDADQGDDADARPSVAHEGPPASDGDEEDGAKPRLEPTPEDKARAARKAGFPDTGDKPNYGNAGHPGFVDAGFVESADHAAKAQAQDDSVRDRQDSGEFQIGDQVRYKGGRYTVQAVKDDGDKLSLISVDGKHALDAASSDVEPYRPKQPKQ